MNVQFSFETYTYKGVTIMKKSIIITLAVTLCALTSCGKDNVSLELSRNVQSENTQNLG